MKPIKKSEQLLINKIKNMEEEEENIQPETKNIPEAEAMKRQVINVENREPNYVPMRDNPIVQSVGNSGWQISDIWRDIRVDDFSD
jgi:hypothetical protein